LGTSVVFRNTFLSAICVLFAFSAIGQDESIEVAPLVYDQKGKSYFPKSTNGLFDVLHFEVNLAQHPYKEISIQQQNQFSVWINHQLIEKAGGRVSYSTDSLRNIYGSSILLSVHSSDGLSRKLSVQIIPSFKPEIAIENANQFAKERIESSFPDFIGTGFVILILLMALLRISYPKIFREYFNPAAVFFPRVSVDTLIQSRQFNPGTFLALFTFSFMVMYVLLIILNWQTDLPPVFEIFKTDSYGMLMIILGIGFVSTFIVFMAKYIFITICSYLFGIEHFKQVHFFDYIRVSSIIYLAMLIWILYNFFVVTSPIASSASVALTVLVILFVVRIIILLIKLIRTASLRFSYLFSYLCTTEIIPLVVVLKLISVF